MGWVSALADPNAVTEWTIVIGINVAVVWAVWRLAVRLRR